MKLIQCIIQPYKLDVVVEALRAAAPGLTVFEAKGHGRQKGHPILYRGVEYAATLLPKLMIEVVANDNRVDDIVRIVVNAAGAGQIGDGRIFILPVEESYHVRTGFMELD